jgi:hypothetical protein
MSDIRQIRRLLRTNTFYLSDFGATGGNATVDTAAMIAWKANLTNKSVTLVIDKPRNGNSPYFLNQDLAWGLNGAVQGGTVIVEWPVAHSVQQTIYDYCTIRGAAEMIGNPFSGADKNGAAFVAFGDTTGSTPWVAPGATTTLRNRAAWRMGDTHGKILTAARFEHILFFKISGPNRVGQIETCSIGVYGDGLQENAGLEKCIFQGFRQPVSFPYAPSLVNGRNANFHLWGNNFNGPGAAITDTSGAASAGTTIPLAGTGTVSGCTGVKRTLGLNVGDYLGVQTSSGWEVGVVTAVTDNVSAEIWPATVGTIASGAVVHHLSPIVDVYSGAATLIERNTAVAGNSPTLRVSPAFRLAGRCIHLTDFHTERSLAAVEIGGMVVGDDGTFPGSKNIVIENGSANALQMPDMDFVRVPARTAGSDALAAGIRPARAVDGVTIRGLVDNTSTAGGFYPLNNWLNDGGDTVTGRKALSFARTGGPDSMAEPIVMEPYFFDSGNGYTGGPSTRVYGRTDTRNVTLAVGTFNDYNRGRAKQLRVTLSGSGNIDINSIADCQVGDELLITLVSVGAGPGTLRLMNNAGASADGKIWLPAGNLTVAVNTTVRLVGTLLPSNVRGWVVFQTT